MPSLAVGPYVGRSPQEVICPKCGANYGERCRNPDGTLQTTHGERFREFEREEAKKMVYAREGKFPTQNLKMNPEVLLDPTSEIQKLRYRLQWELMKTTMPPYVREHLSEVVEMIKFTEQALADGKELPYVSRMYTEMRGGTLRGVPHQWGGYDGPRNPEVKLTPEPKIQERPAPTKKASTPRVTFSEDENKPILVPNGTILERTEKPWGKREGTSRHARFLLYGEPGNRFKPEEYVAKGGHKDDISWDLRPRDGYIRVVTE